MTPLRSGALRKQPSRTTPIFNKSALQHQMIPHVCLFILLIQFCIYCSFSIGVQVLALHRFSVLESISFFMHWVFVVYAVGTGTGW
ncbi:hypothetical protein BGX38DRAFT_1185692 [Terfezia claveryi]|nr:hypothetical protein BGX38DRAFT_1242629 [Terfezia claveryi]KAF8449992.1 hypothetical protein BGX38DRAFT_1185692 [Terfezia claveryi]